MSASLKSLPHKPVTSRPDPRGPWTVHYPRSMTVATRVCPSLDAALDWVRRWVGDIPGVDIRDCYGVSLWDYVPLPNPFARQE